MSLSLDFTFDPVTYRHYMNGFLTVLHCHHYMCLYTEAAEKFEDCGGTTILKEVTEDAMRPIFDDYYQKHNVADPVARLEVCSGFYAAMGMGKLIVEGSDKGGTAKLIASHVDQGWIKKWGKRDKPVNYFTCGFLAASMAATFGLSPRSFEIVEEKSIVKGDSVSVFQIKRK
jgi:hypothetical protein